MKLKLVATIKKEALLPGMEQAVLDPPAQVQTVDAAEQTAMNQLRAKYPRHGDWNGEDLVKDLESYMQKHHPNQLYGIGFEGPNLLDDEMHQRRMAMFNARNQIAQKQEEAKKQKDNTQIVYNTTLSGVAGRQFFINADKNLYVLAY